LPRSSSPTSALLFAGGRATRLGGTNKALLTLGGRTIVDRVVDALSPLVDECLVLTNDRSLAGDPRLTLVPDVDPHAGVLPALAGGLQAATGALCLVAACDMPFVSRSVFELLLDVQAERDADVVIPRVDDRLEPMHAVYRRATALAAAADALARGQQRMTAFLASVRVVEVLDDALRRLDPDLRAFFNLNTPDDLAEAERLAAAPWEYG
jgi:molybdopterin-guanine dinucleotide biosynthesis protein A